MNDQLTRRAAGKHVTKILRVCVVDKSSAGRSERTVVCTIPICDGQVSHIQREVVILTVGGDGCL